MHGSRRDRPEPIMAINLVSERKKYFCNEDLCLREEFFERNYEEEKLCR